MRKGFLMITVLTCSIFLLPNVALANDLGNLFQNLFQPKKQSSGDPRGVEISTTPRGATTYHVWATPEQARRERQERRAKNFRARLILGTDSKERKEKAIKDADRMVPGLGGFINNTIEKGWGSWFSPNQKNK